MDLPPALRHRWALTAGGEVSLIDLGDAALIVPLGLDAARREARRAVQAHDEDGLALLDEPDLADQ